MVSPDRDGFPASSLAGPLLALPSPVHGFSICVYLAFNLELNTWTVTAKGTGGRHQTTKSRKAGKRSGQTLLRSTVLGDWCRCSYRNQHRERLQGEDRVNRHTGGLATSGGKYITRKSWYNRAGPTCSVFKLILNLRSIYQIHPSNWQGKQAFIIHFLHEYMAKFPSLALISVLIPRLQFEYREIVFSLAIAVTFF